MLLCVIGVVQYMDKQATDATGNKLDMYEMEASAERNDTLQDLAEFQLAAVRNHTHTHMNTHMHTH